MTYSGSLVFLYVTDLRRSSEFYRKLGLDVIVDQGSCHILGVGDQMMVGVCGGREPSPDGVIVTLVTDDVEARCQALIARGIVLEKPATYNPDYDITHAFLRDPDGYLVEIQRFGAAR